MKITFFLGRIHHAIKLLPVATALQQAGAQIDILVTDNSINIDPATEYLHQFGVQQFHHAKDYLDGYQRVTWGDFPSTLRTMVPPFWMQHSTTEALQNVYCFSKYLSAQKPDAVFALHENNFFVKTLFYCARQAGIRTYSLQEGMILEREETDMAKYSTGTDYTDILFSWSEYDKRFYSDPEKIVPVGPSHLDEWIIMRERELLYGDMTKFKTGFRQSLGYGYAQSVVVFAPPRLDLYRGDPFRAMNALAEWTRNRGIGLVVKLHPFQGGVEQIQKQFEQYAHMRIRNDADGIPYIAGADVLITQTSTVALEALVLGVPVVELDMDYIGLEQSLAKLGAATLIEGNDLGGLFDTKSVLGFIESRFPLADGQSTKRIVDYVMARRRIK